MNKKYIRQIMKKLTCSKAKRKEIEKQITSEFMAEIENGETSEAVMQRMGAPAEIAEEFNSSFSGEEKKRYKKEKLIKRLMIIIAIVVIVGAAVYWILPKSYAIGDSKRFQKKEVQAQAEKVLDLFNAEDYLALQECSTGAVKDLMNKEELDEAKSYFGSDWGEVQTKGNVYIEEINQNGKHWAEVQMNVSYDHANVTFTFYFNEDLMLEGLWLK
ncbi:DUF3887 domain-containing protein [Anaerosporobacter sp.]